MGKFRSKLKGQTKGRRWPKGQSSSSNPETRKFRDQAKSRFFQQDTGIASNLTAEALNKHNAVQSWISNPKAAPANSKMDDEVSAGSTHHTVETMDTFASDWTNCTNMSYSHFLQVFRSDSAVHKEMLSVLAAIAEVIKENGGSESPVEYYCALLTTLEQILNEPEQKEEQVTAILCLINMGIKKVPPAVLLSGYGAVTKMMLDILGEYSNKENNMVIKGVLGILTEFIKSQEPIAWQHPDVVKVFNSMVNPFSIHSRAKWRKEAQKGLTSIVVSLSLKSLPVNPAADLISEFCQQTLNGCLGSNTGSVLVTSIQAGQTTILHTLGFMKLTMPYFSKTNMKKSCELLLRLMSLNYPLVTSCSMQALHALFSTQKAVMSSKLNAQLITALYDYQPAANDLQPTLAWIVVMQQAHVHMADVDLSLCALSLPKVIASLTQLWLTEKPTIMTATTNALKIILQDCIGPITSDENLLLNNRSKLQKCFQTLETALGYQYHSVWHQVLHVIGTMFEVAGGSCSDMFVECLKSLAELRDSYKFSYNNELEYAVGAAVRYIGPEVVLSVIELKKSNGELNLERSWLLPVLKENIRNTKLKYWLEHIFPLAVYCQKKANQLAQNNDGIGSHSSELLHLQLWNLLPSFCNNPTDIADSFKGVAKVLGTAISERKELRLPVMASLRKLINSARDNDAKDDENEIARFDKNYLPILFNVYTMKPVGSDDEGQRLAALETIKVYLQIARQELREQLFKHALDKVRGNTTDEDKSNCNDDDSFLKESLMDLIRALIHYQNKENIAYLYETCIKDFFTIKNKRHQKKAYRLLEDVCSSESVGCKQFLKGNRKQIQGLLSKSLDSSAVSSKGARMRCFLYLIKQQPHLNHECKFIKTCLSEAIASCKDINERCRTTAYNLINAIGETLEHHNETQQFVTMLLAGLVGTMQMMSCTVLALASVLHNFSGALGKENIDCILDNVCKLMTVPTREIVGSCLSFVKVYTSAMPSPVVAATLPVLVNALTAMNDDCKRHFRLKVRDILDRFVRKYGCDAIIPHVPESDTVMHKRLRNLRKIHARKKKQKEENKKQEDDDASYDEFVINSKNKSMEDILADSDSDYNDMEVDEEKQRPKSAVKGNKTRQAWIEEDEDSIVDFTDPTARTKITATKPEQGTQQFGVQKKKQQNSDRGFKTSSDGRLIIEDQSDSDTDNIKFNKANEPGDESDSGDDAETLLLTDRKRKRGATSVKSGFSSQTEPPSKYKPGGKGIHRSTSGSVSGSTSIAGSEYKAKKAKGDTKKKGKFDPYAYLPLQRTALNKRKRAKNAGQFKNVIKGAKAGASKGKRLKRLNK